MDNSTAQYCFTERSGILSLVIWLVFFVSVLTCVAFRERRRANKFQSELALLRNREDPKTSLVGNMAASDMHTLDETETPLASLDLEVVDEKQIQTELANIKKDLRNAHRVKVDEAAVNKLMAQIGQDTNKSARV